MYEGITYEEFKRLTDKEKCDAYEHLSDHDKFRARISFPDAGETIEPDKPFVETEEERIKRERESYEFFKKIGLGDKLKDVFEERLKPRK